MAVLLSTALFETDGPSRSFLTVEEIKAAIRLSKNYRLDGSDPSQALPLLLYHTRRQQTWLVKTPKRLYCLLDDLRKPQPHVNWSMSMREVLDPDGRLKIRIKADPSAGADEATGRVDIGEQHKGWLYSAKLFTVRSVEEELRLFLEKQQAVEFGTAGIIGEAVTDVSHHQDFLSEGHSSVGASRTF